MDPVCVEFTPGNGIYVIPEGANRVLIEAFGAQGGDSQGFLGGLGGYTLYEVSGAALSGSSFTYNVGTGGSSATDQTGGLGGTNPLAFLSGGDGGSTEVDGTVGGAGGGAGTQVTSGLTGPIVAGGGGGAGSFDENAAAANGGDGGGFVAEDGEPDGLGGVGGNATAETYGAGGVGGTPAENGEAGSNTGGGDGGSSVTVAGGGGGGGFFAGGGGGADDESVATGGGGGGSAYFDSVVDSSINLVAAYSAMSGDEGYIPSPNGRDGFLRIKSYFDVVQVLQVPRRVIVAYTKECEPVRVPYKIRAAAGAETVCEPPSRSLFPVGDTLVRCTSTLNGMRQKRTFLVRVINICDETGISLTIQ